MLARSISTLLCLVLITTAAFAGDTRSWANLRELSPGKPIEVMTTNGKTLSGSFVSFSEESISIRTKQQDVSVPRAEVSRVRHRPGARATWIGAGIGAGAGAGIGYAGGQGLGNISGGDFARLTPAFAGAGAVVGALVGAVAGHLIGGRHTTIYRSK
jgi:hypothetical protein